MHGKKCRPNHCFIPANVQIDRRLWTRRAAHRMRGHGRDFFLVQFTGVSSQELHNQTNVKLSEGNFVLVKTNVVGQSRGFALLGIITIVPAEFNTAFSRLYSQAGMESGKAQTLVDVAVERTGSYWILFSLPRCTVRADVVQFMPEPGAKPATEPLR
jgi:hypothetical protein